MVDFNIFLNSIMALSAEINTMHGQSVASCNWGHFKNIFRNIKIMEGKTIIVGNSKVLANMLPSIAAPINSQYTLQYLFGNKYIYNHIDQWKLYENIHAGFYHQLLSDARIQTWLQGLSRSVWDTSDMKIIDNLVIGAVRAKSGVELKKLSMGFGPNARLPSEYLRMATKRTDWQFRLWIQKEIH